MAISEFSLYLGANFSCQIKQCLFNYSFQEKSLLYQNERVLSTKLYLARQSVVAN